MYEGGRFFVSPSHRLFESLCQLTEFTVTGDHLKLLRRAFSDTWYEGEGDYGAAGIGCKRPYGNSYIEGDVAEILGSLDEDWVYEDGDRAYLTSEAEARFLRLHIEAMAALGIVLAVGEFRAGRYQRSDVYDRDWQRVGDGG